MSLPDDPQWRARYEAHIRSSRWNNMKRDMVRLRGNKCERCGCCRPLELHHKTYARLGRELTSDLEVLCKQCHESADRERDLQRERRAAATQHRNAVDTYATKKYGEEWDRWQCPEAVEEEFDRWLDRKGDEY
jgi:hypothetical protein